MVPCLTPQRSPIKGGIPNKYPLYKAYMGLLIDIPMVDCSFLQAGIAQRHVSLLPFLSQVVLDLKLPAAVVLHSTDELCV